jgi:hypothetical protein
MYTSFIRPTSFPWSLVVVSVPRIACRSAHKPPSPPSPGGYDSRPSSPEPPEDRRTIVKEEVALEGWNRLTGEKINEKINTRVEEMPLRLQTVIASNGQMTAF